MKMRILVVDDHPPVREALRYVFAAVGWRMTETATRAEAVRALGAGAFDIVLFDIGIDTAAGFDALREFKQLRPSIPVLVHSLRDNARLLSRSLRLGAAGYMIKGLDKNLLIDAVSRVAAGDQVWSSEQLNRIKAEEADLRQAEGGDEA